MHKSERIDSLGLSPSKNPLSEPAASAPSSAVSSVSQQLSCMIQSATIQPKLKIGKPDDRFEQQADQVAEKVIAVPSPFGRSPVARQPLEEEQSAQTRPIQRQAEEEEEPVQTKSLIQRQAEEEEEEEPVQAKSLVQRQAEEEEEPVQTKSLIQRQAEEEEEEPVQAKSLVQRQAEEEEEPVQAKSQVQTQVEEEDVLQGKFSVVEPSAQVRGNVGKAEARSGMPRPLKAGLETLSGMDLSGVRVHNNSSKPGQLHALAYTQGQDIHVAPGQEKHLPHEGWHVVQQMQGRVRPTMQTTGVSINNDAGLEREADVMGSKAMQRMRVSQNSGNAKVPDTSSQSVESASGVPSPGRVVKFKRPIRRGGAPQQLALSTGQTLVQRECPSCEDEVQGKPQQKGETVGPKLMGKNGARRAVKPERLPGQPVTQFKKIDHRTLTWADFKGRPRRSKLEAETKSSFHDPRIKKVVPSAKSLKAVESGEACRQGRRTTKIHKVNIAIDPAKIRVRAYMWQEKSWAKAWITNQRARVRRCRAGLVRKCKAVFVKMHRKIRKQRNKAIQVCKRDYNKWRREAIREGNKHLMECRKALMGGSIGYEVSVGGKRIRADSVKRCRTVLMKQYRKLRIGQWSHSREFKGEVAKAGTKKACGREFAKRYEELARKSLTWTAEQAGEQATITSEAACSTTLLTACRDRILPAASRELLKHEQVHFDITEVKARETEAELRGIVVGFDKEVTACGKRRALSKAKRTLRENVRRLVKAYNAKVKDLNATQKRYDKETKHGKVMKTQATWTKTITGELTK